MILETLHVDRSELARQTGWEIKPQGACKRDRCVPLGALPEGDKFDVRVLADRLNMPLVHDAASGVWSLGPEAGGRALDTVHAPELQLPDLDGNLFELSSLRGMKVLLVAWASW